MIVNDLEEPMPSIRRCLAWGRLLRQAIESYPSPLPVAVLGTGGLSHSIGEPTMGWIDEEFIDSSRHASAQLPDAARRALDSFVARPPASGALVLHGLPVCYLPATSAVPTESF